MALRCLLLLLGACVMLTSARLPQWQGENMPYTGTGARNTIAVIRWLFGTNVEAPFAVRRGLPIEWLARVLMGLLLTGWQFPRWFQDVIDQVQFDDLAYEAAKRDELRLLIVGLDTQHQIRSEPM